MARIWLSSFLEKEAVFLTSRATHWRNLQLKPPIRLVSPLDFAAAR